MAIPQVVGFKDYCVGGAISLNSSTVQKNHIITEFPFSSKSKF